MPRGNLPQATDPYHSLMDSLNELRLRLDQTGTRAGSMGTIEAYDNFVKGSEFGRDCQFSIKTLALFKLEDYNDLKNLVTKIYSIFQQIEGK